MESSINLRIPNDLREIERGEIQNQIKSIDSPGSLNNYRDIISNNFAQEVPLPRSIAKQRLNKFNFPEPSPPPVHPRYQIDHRVSQRMRRELEENIVKKTNSFIFNPIWKAN